MFDLILCSEGIYKVDSFEVLAALLEHLLKPMGQAFFSAKRFYFGCGGGTREFSKFLDARGKFDTKAVAIFDDKKSNVREILRIRWKGEWPENTEDEKRRQKYKDEGRPTPAFNEGRPTTIHDTGILTMDDIHDDDI